MFNLTNHLIIDIGLIIILATIFAYLARFLRQPLIPAYIATGIVLGPLVLGLISDMETIKVLSEMGIAFLLFIVGLEINIKKLKTVGLVSIFVGVIQVILTFVLGFIAANYLGFTQITSIYLGLVIAFSSTMVVIKLLSDKNRLETLHGRIIVGILLVQDLLVVIALASLKALTSFSYTVLFTALGKGLLILLIAILFSKFLLPGLFRFAARSQELLFLAALTVCFFFASLSYLVDFSIAIGAFIAGVSLASLPYSVNIIGRVLSLKDFFATIFFVSLGMQLIPFSFTMIKPLIILLVLVIFIKPLIIIIFTILFVYEKRTAFLTGLSLGQISEFSLILVTLAYYSFSAITQEVFSLVIVLTIITLVLTAYMMKYENALYHFSAPVLKILDKFNLSKKKLEYRPKGMKHKIVLFGCHRIGNMFLNTLKTNKKNIIVVDHNPETIERLIKLKYPSMYGDASNIEVLEKLNLKKTKIIISSIPDEDDNAFLISYAKAVNPKIMVFATTNHLHQALNLYELGADYVIVPHIIGGKKIANLLKKIISRKVNIHKVKNDHIKELLGMDILNYRFA